MIARGTLEYPVAATRAGKPQGHGHGLPPSLSVAMRWKTAGPKRASMRGTSIRTSLYIKKGRLAPPFFIEQTDEYF
jgi:hypothetical protein